MRCPKCGDNTKRTTRTERCVIKSCEVDLIVRNERGEAWGYNTRGQTVIQPYPNSVAHLRVGPRRADVPGEYNPLDAPADHAQARRWNDWKFGRQVGEPESAA